MDSNASGFWCILFLKMFFLNKTHLKFSIDENAKSVDEHWSIDVQTRSWRFMAIKNFFKFYWIDFKSIYLKDEKITYFKPITFFFIIQWIKLIFRTISWRLQQRKVFPVLKRMYQNDYIKEYNKDYKATLLKFY